MRQGLKDKQAHGHGVTQKAIGTPLMSCSINSVGITSIAHTESSGLPVLTYLLFLFIGIRRLLLLLLQFCPQLKEEDNRLDHDRHDHEHVNGHENDLEHPLASDVFVGNVHLQQEPEKHTREDNNVPHAIDPTIPPG